MLVLSRSCIYCRLNNRGYSNTKKTTMSQRRIPHIMSGTFCLLEHDPYQLDLPVRNKKSRRKAEDTGSLPSYTIQHVNGNTDTTTSVHQTREERIMTNLKERKGGRKVESISVYLDSILKTLPREATESDKQHLLHRCKLLWGDCLEKWYSYIVFRSSGISFDTYWIPPYSDQQITLRSAAEIVRYIDIAITGMKKETCFLEEIHFDEINKVWKEKKNKGGGEVTVNI